MHDQEKTRESLLTELAELRRQVAALTEAETRFRLVVEGLGEGVIITDQRDVIDYVNPRMAAMTGYRPEEMVGCSTYELLLPETEWATLRQRNERRLRGIAEQYEIALRKRDGALFWTEIHATPFFDAAGQIVGTLSAITDISERKRLEEQFRHAQKMESVGRLAGGVAHDFNNLLTAVIGYAELAEDKLSSDSPARSDLQQILKAAERAAGLTSQLLAFARRQVIAPKTINLNHLTLNMEKMLRVLIGEDIELIARTHAEQATVKADPCQIEQVVVNLAINARDAMPHGERF